MCIYYVLLTHEVRCCVISVHGIHFCIALTRCFDASFANFENELPCHTSRGLPCWPRLLVDSQARGRCYDMVMHRGNLSSSQLRGSWHVLSHVMRVCMCCSLVVLVCYPSFVVVVFFESVLVCILYPLFYVLFNMTGNPVLGDGYRERKKKLYISVGM